MNKRDMRQLRASVARDLIQGQGEHTATRDLLKQYAPLEGVVTVPGERKSPRPLAPVEKSMASDATVAPNDCSPRHGAKVALPATIAPAAGVASLAMVKGELRVPNTINFRLFPTLDPFAKAVYYQLFLLSHGFRRDTCVVGLAKLAESVLMSQRKVQNTITYLERRGLIKRLRAVFGGPAKGNLYQVPIPMTGTAADATVADGSSVVVCATVEPHAAPAVQATVVSDATNTDDDEYKKQSSSKGDKTDHRGAAAPRERQEITVRSAYEKITGNRWNKADSAIYAEHELDQVPVERIISVLDAVTRRTPFKINSLKYFIKEILATPDPRNRAWQKRKLTKIIARVRDNSVGRADYSGVDFLEDVKCACAREDVVFADDIYNELVQ